MQQKKSVSSPKKGMNRSGNLTNSEYSFALNANTSNEVDDSGFNIQKEPSNFLSTVFPTGYAVIGFKNDILKNRTYYFLTSTETNKLSPDYKRSSIGYVDNTIEETFNQDTVVDGCEECEKRGTIDAPLETITQVPSQTYVILEHDKYDCISVADIEEKGLNFDINFPIKKIEIQQEKLGTLLYWDDNRNPSRYLNVTDLEENTPNYLHIREIPCGDDETSSCLLVDKLLVFPKHSKIIIEAKEEQIGGNLKKGTYEFYGAYCDLSGNTMSQYSTPTNPISIFDENNNILSQTTTDEFTNFAIKLQIKNLDTKNFKYYKIAVVERNNVEAQQSVFLAGVYPTTDDTVVYTHSGSNNDDLYISRGNVSIKRRLTFEELTAIKPTYEKFKGTMVSGNALWHFGATVREEINLQPAVNLFSIVHWSSSLAKEDLYKSAVATSKYKGYMRNEVQPFSIRFYNKDGSYSANFPLIGRPKNGNDSAPLTKTSGSLISGETYIINELNAGDNFSNVGFTLVKKPFIASGTTPTSWSNLTEVMNVNFASIDSSTNVCGTNDRTERWQVFNTATKYEDICNNGLNQIITEPEIIKKNCTVDSVHTIGAGTTTIFPTIDDPYYDLESYLETHEVEGISEYIKQQDGSYVEYPGKNCDVIFNGDCGAPELLPNSVIQIQDIFGAGEGGKELVVPNPKDIADYLRSVPPSFCSPYLRDSTSTSGGYAQDNGDYNNMEQYMGCSRTSRKKLYIRDSDFVNENCGYATTLFNQETPSQTGQAVFLNYDGSLDIADLKQSSYPVHTTTIGGNYQDKLHTKAQFFKVDVNSREKVILEITKKTKCPRDKDQLPYVDDNHIRYTIYDNCTNKTVLAGAIVDLNVGMLEVLDMAFLQSQLPLFSQKIKSFVVAIDAPIIEEDVPIVCIGFGGGSTHTTYKVVPPCGCFSIYTRDIEYKSIAVSWTSIVLEKVQEYTSECTFSIPSIGSCGVVPYQKGKFSYWQSTETYPDNKQLYDSSGLFIKESDLDLLSIIDKAYFIEYYTDGGNKDIFGNYILKEVDLTCQPIRHFKFPDNTVSPYIYENPTAKVDSQSLISPLGIEIDSNAIKTMLQVAVNNKLITKKQLNNIQGYEILRGDNSIHKSVIANGIASDIYNYTKKNQVIHYTNFPFNDLGENKFCLNSGITPIKPIQHPHGGDYNHLFSFISPDVFLTKPSIPTEVTLQGYIFGSANAEFTQVDKHSKWTVLGQKSRNTATQLSILEVALEFVIEIGNASKEASAFFGTSSGGNYGSWTAVGAIIAGRAVGAFIRIGKYRYEWLKIFRDLGRTENFASFQTASANYNRFIPTEQYSPEYLRRLAIRKYMRDGDFTFTDENNGDTLKVNNWLREHSIFLSTNKDYPFNYPDEYKSFDNNIVNKTNSSTFTSSEVGGEIKNNHVRNVASPYFSLKNYIPDQWGQIDSIKWLTTNYIFDLDDDTTCSPILGGTVCVSRFSWRKKTPIFTSNAIDEPDKLPFLYSRYDNIGTPRFYCDYEVGGVWDKFALPFPDINSTAKFDDESSRNDFYYKHPSKFYLYTHGVVNFLVESEINCNFRYARNEPKDWFYPQNQNLPVWLQEKHLPISEPNTFFYNNTYTFPVSNTPYKFLDKTYDKEIWAKRNHQPNAWIWSEKDVNENSLINPWLVYKPLNWFEDKSNKGKLLDLRSIESEQFLGRFENQLQLYNTIDNIAERITPQNKETGTGFFYQRPIYQRPIEFKATELGFSGTQNTDICSTPYGHFWADAKRGRIFQLDQNGKSMEIISEMIQNQPSGMKQWFREHLPFKILKTFPQADIDNKFKGLGMNIWYDDRMSRVFFTKRDYLTKGECLKYEEGLGFYEDCTEETLSCPEGYTYNEGLGTCTLIEVVNADCVCTADVFATPQTIGSGAATNIGLTSTTTGISYSWTTVQVGVTGATSGSGNTINQVLIGEGTATYTITPFETVGGCTGTPINIIVTVEALVINENTQINIWFDNSGSMASTLPKLQTMASTILKPCLLPFYNNDSALYDSMVNVQNFSTVNNDIDPNYERYIRLLGSVSTNPAVTKTINIAFQDESTPYGVGGLTNNFNGILTAQAIEDIALLKSNLTTEPENSLFGILFQVVRPDAGFKFFVEAASSGSNPFTGINNLSDIPQITHITDIIAGSTATYYTNLIITALNSLGFELEPCNP